MGTTVSTAPRERLGRWWARGGHAGEGWLALLGGGEFSFGETLAADWVWVERTPPGPIGFVPAASGSMDYGTHFAAYLGEAFGRPAETVPVYRARDARRGKNVERLRSAPAVYLGGGVADHLLDTFAASPGLDALAERLRRGGGVVAIAAAAHACGSVVRSLHGGGALAGWGWLGRGVVEPNFDPGHDRRLRRLLSEPGVEWGLGIPAGSAVLLGPGEGVEVVGVAFAVEGAEGDLEAMGGGGGAETVGEGGAA